MKYQYNLFLQSQPPQSLPHTQALQLRWYKLYEYKGTGLCYLLTSL